MAKYEDWQALEDLLAGREEKEFRNRHNDRLTGIENMTKIICDRCDCENSEVAKIQTIGLFKSEVFDRSDKSKFTCELKRDLCKSCYSDVLAFVGNKP